MFYKEDYTFELGTFAVSQNIISHLKQEAMSQFDRLNVGNQFIVLCNSKGISADDQLNFKLKNLSYMWAINLELGIETLAVYLDSLDTPVVVVDQPLAWKDEPHHKHMAEFVNHHLGKSAENRRRHGAEFILRELNKISIKFLEDEIRVIQNAATDESARRALLTIDAGK